MKRPMGLLSALIVCIMITVSLTSCSSAKKELSPADDGILDIYASFYPIYALADMVIGDTASVRLNCLVQPQDGCLRSYQLSEWDLALLAGSADAVITGGQGLESFETILYALGEKGPALSSILYGMELRSIKPINHREDSDSHWNTANPHIYMQIDGAIEILNRIAAFMQVIDPENAEQYTKNAESITNRLTSMHNEAAKSLESYTLAPVIVLNEALLYTPQEYGLEIALCYDRESGENIEGAALDGFLQTLAACDAKIVLIEKQAPQTFCNALEQAGYTVVRLDILSTRRADQGAEGYFDAYQENTQALLNAFSAA